MSLKAFVDARETKDAKWRQSKQTIANHMAEGDEREEKSPREESPERLWRVRQA